MLQHKLKSAWSAGVRSKSTGNSGLFWTLLWIMRGPCAWDFNLTVDAEREPRRLGPGTRAPRAAGPPTLPVTPSHAGTYGRVTGD